MTRRVLVTGATRGLGLEISRRLLEGGYEVLGTGRSDPKGFADLTAEFEGARFLQLDLADAASFHPFYRKHLSAGLFGLVNNAAIAHDGVLATMHDSQLDEMVRVNVLGTLALTKYALRPMLKDRTGRIINVSSIIGQTGFRGLVGYAATKSAMIGMTRSLAREVGRAGITVNAIMPGYMETDMSQGLSAEGLDKIIRRTPLGQLAHPKEVAGAVAFLLGEDARHITGTTLTIDGGSTA